MISLFLPFVMPVGSNAEPSFYGKETCFLTLPLVMYVLFEELMPKKEQLERRAAMCMIGVLGAGLLFFNLTHKQMEEGNRIACRYTVDSQLTRGILTTKENADMYNYLIREVKPHIRQGSYMICSFSLPAVSILDCKPWAVYSTVYSTDRMNIFYDFDKATLRPESTKALDELVKLLNENPNVTIELSAHCDYKGSDAYNEKLSQRRAEAVVHYLIEHGIAADRLTPVGYGKKKPKVVRKKLTEKYPWLKEGDTLTEEFIKKLKKDPTRKLVRLRRHRYNSRYDGCCRSSR